MAREIVGLSKPGARQQVVPQARASARQTAGSRGVLRTKRSVSYLGLIRSLDGGTLHGRADLQPVFDAIAAEFTPSGSTVPKGIVARCFLGPPFEVHSLDLFQDIVEHYGPATLMPEPMESYRRLALHPSYAVVEIYDDRVICILNDGGTVEIER